MQAGWQTSLLGISSLLFLLYDVHTEWNTQIFKAHGMFVNYRISTRILISVCFLFFGGPLLTVERQKIMGEKGECDM